MREKKNEVFVLYNRQKLEYKYSKNAIVKIQDIFVSHIENVLFIEYEKSKREKIKNYIHKIAENNTYIIILGNHNMIEFEKIKSPVNDGDGFIFTDNYFSARTKNMIVQDIPISRIPIPEYKKLLLYLKKLDNILINKKINLNERFGLSAHIWQKAALNVFTICRGMGEMLISPPFDIKKDTLQFDKFNGTMYYNLHGSKNLSGWYGQKENDYPIAIMPKVFNKGVQQSFFVSEACFGGYIINKTKENSVVLSAINAGMPFMIASTATAYGTFYPPVSEADLFAKLFISFFNKGLNAGKSFIRAKHEFIRHNIKKNGFLDNDDKKTLLTFTLYGNPLIGKYI